MGAREKPEKQPESVLGLGLRSDTHEASAWRPSQALRERPQDSGTAKANDTRAPQANSSTLAGAARDAREQSTAAWRPSESVKERLSFLSPVRARRRFAMPRGVRLAASSVLFAIGFYVFLKLWLLPTAGDLHPVLLIFIGALILLLIAAIVGSFARRRHRKREDEKSTLRL